MRISDQERREIAKKLRYAASYGLGGLSLQRNLAEITKAEGVSWRGVMRRLADLIDRPVAEAVDRKELGYDTCGRCGLDFAVFQPIPGGLGEAVYARHCPNCGAELTWKESE